MQFPTSFGSGNCCPGRLWRDATDPGRALDGYAHPLARRERRRNGVQPMSVIKEFPTSFASGTKPSATDFTLKLTAFDQRKYRKIIAARAETIRRVVSKLNPLFRFSTALDAGCGVGFFSKTLEDCDLRVCGFDGREENVAEARRRYPSVPFETADIEHDTIRQLGRFDFVLCCGLLYHLESPLRAVRNLRALTEKCL